MANRPTRSTRCRLAVVLVVLAALLFGAATGRAAPSPIPAAALRHVTITLGADPVAPLVGPGGVWAMIGSEAQALQRIDVHTNRPVGPRIPVPLFSRFAIGPRTIYFPGPSGIVRLDSRTGAQLGVDPFSGPSMIAASPDLGPPQPTRSFEAQVCPTLVLHIYDAVCAAGRWATFPRQGASPTRAVWVIANPDNLDERAEVVLRLDPATGAVTRVLSTGARALFDIDVDRAGAIWLAGYYGVSKVTPQGKITRIGRSVGRWPSVAVSNRAAWVVGHSARMVGGYTHLTKRLQRIDLATARPVGRPLVLGTGGLSQNVIAIRGGSAWIAGPKIGELTRVYLPSR